MEAAGDPEVGVSGETSGDAAEVECSAKTAVLCGDARTAESSLPSSWSPLLGVEGTPEVDAACMR